ncbi:hypothetical protein DL771_006886 [Monosporascus sp. 5C6A]|nr:hypothetical protein DL771_006886 [Monosporascus sp. 5C6A]
MLPVQENREIQRATRWGQIKGKLGLNTTAKPLHEPAYKVRKAAGKEKATESLAAKRAAVGAAEGLGNLQDGSDEDEAGPSPTKKLKKEEDEGKPVAVKNEEAQKKEEKEVKNEEEEESKPVVKTEGED